MAGSSLDIVISEPTGYIAHDKDDHDAGEKKGMAASWDIHPVDIVARLICALYLLEFLNIIPQIRGLMKLAQDAGEHTMLLRFLPTDGWMLTGALSLSWVGLILSSIQTFGPRSTRSGVFGASMYALQWVAFRDLLLAKIGISGYGESKHVLGSSLGACFYALGAPALASWFWRLIFFREMLWGGLSKILSHGSLWGNLAAVHWHFQTYSMPRPLASFAFFVTQNTILARLCTAFALTVELSAPCLTFSSRWHVRLIAVIANAMFQSGIFFTENHLTLNILFGLLPVALLSGEGDEPSSAQDGILIAAAGVACILIATLTFPTVPLVISHSHILSATVVSGVALTYCAALRGLARQVRCEHTRTQWLQFAIGGTLLVASFVMTADTFFSGSAPLLSSTHRIQTVFQSLAKLIPMGILANVNGFFNAQSRGGLQKLVMQMAHREEGPWQDIPIEYSDWVKPPPWNFLRIPFFSPLFWQVDHHSSPICEKDPSLVRFLRAVLQGDSDVMKLVRSSIAQAPAGPPKFVRLQPMLYKYTPWFDGQTTWYTRQATQGPQDPLFHRALDEQTLTSACKIELSNAGQLVRSAAFLFPDTYVREGSCRTATSSQIGKYKSRPGHEFL